MSNTYYCHECEARRPVIWNPMVTCVRCGCNVVDQIPLVENDSNDDFEDDIDAELDFFFNQEEQEDDDDEETLEERCLYERVYSLYNYPARTVSNNSSNESSSSRRFGLDEDVVTYDIQFEQNTLEETESTSTFLLPFTQASRILEPIYSSYRSDEESEDGSDNYHRRSLLDHLADILPEFLSSIDRNRNLLTTTPSHSVDSILATVKKECLKPTDADVNEECIICQENFGTTLEVYYLPCKHKYHGSCISRWFSVNTSCPICRQSVDITQIAQETPAPLRPEMVDHINREIDLLFASADPFDDEEDDHVNHDSGFSRSDMNRHIENRGTSSDYFFLSQFMDIYDPPSSNYSPVATDLGDQRSSMEEVD